MPTEPRPNETPYGDAPVQHTHLVSPEGISFGIWNGIINYKFNNIVLRDLKDGGPPKMYRSLQDNNRGNLPENHPLWWEEWGGGGSGSVTVEHNYLGIYNPLYSYSTSNMVTYNNVIYYALVDNVGITPGTLPATGIWVPYGGTNAELRNVFILTEGVYTYDLSTNPTNVMTVKPFLNGILLEYPNMFVISGNQITLLPDGMDYDHETGWELVVFFT